MKRKYFYIMLIITLITGCTYDKNQSNLSVSLQVIKKTDCNNFCYQLKVIFKNSTDKKVYIPNLHLPEHLFIIDSSGRNVFNDYLKEEIDYYKEHITPKLINSELVEYDGEVELKYDTNQISHKRVKGYYKTFIEDAIRLETSKLIKRNKQLRNNVAWQTYLMNLFNTPHLSTTEVAF